MKFRRMIGSIAVLVPLMALLVASIWFAVSGWSAIEGPAIPAAGYVAMAAGIILTFLVGVGLMALVFYSHRHGYDDAADRGHSEHDE